MGIRGELFSTKFVCEGRTYFFNVKENRTGDVFLSIVESKPTEGETFDRRSIIVFGEYMDGFMNALKEAIPHMGKPQAKPPRQRPERPAPYAAGQREREMSRDSSPDAHSRAHFQPKAPRQDKISSAEPARKRIVVKRIKKAD